MANKIMAIWNVVVYRGMYSKYNRPALAVKLRSKIIPEASMVFAGEVFWSDFRKKVVPFLASAGPLFKGIESELKTMVNAMISEGKIEDCNSLDELLGQYVPDDVITRYYKNIVGYVNDNPELFAIRSTNSIVVDKDKVYNPNYHNGAYLKDKQYMEKFPTSDGSAPLALREALFKSLADIDMERCQVKDIVSAFVRRGYIFKGESGSVEKDIILSPCKRERCYVIDLSKEV